MKKNGGLIDSITLLLVGVLMIWFVFSGEYWSLLNPKFKWLTAASAVFFVIISLAGIRHRQRPFRGSRLIVLLSLVGFLFLGDPNARVAASIDRSDKSASRILMDGMEYVKINLGELHFLLTMSKSREKASTANEGRYVLRGAVKRHPDLTAANQFMLMRAVVWCCLADATGTGFRVFSDQLDDFKDGEWVQVFGRLKPLEEKPEPIFLRFDKTLVSWINQDYGLVPERIVKISPPEDPYIFNRETEEPFDY